VKVGRESRALPAKLYVNGVQLASFNPVRFGGFASIYRGTLEGKVVFYQEALIWSRMRHPYVLAFLGMDKDVLESPCIVLPWCERGSVIDWVSSLPINTVNLIDLICKISSGLAYLHSQSIVHGDLRG
ncbi:kinase-like protein, partial [Punctularia strigosozonata HHB-11173 SS5]